MVEGRNLCAGGGIDTPTRCADNESRLIFSTGPGFGWGLSYAAAYAARRLRFRMGSGGSSGGDQLIPKESTRNLLVDLGWRPRIWGAAGANPEQAPLRAWARFGGL